MKIAVKTFIYSLIVVLIASLRSGYAQEIVIMTSLPQDYVLPLKTAFEKENPDKRIEFLFKKTSAALTHILTQRHPRPAFLLTPGSDAVKILKHQQMGENFTVSYGQIAALWKQSYLQHLKLPIPQNWENLLDPLYKNHIAITTPLRSATMHAIVENILQTYGWNEGWAYLSELSANITTITAREAGLYEGIEKERFAVALLADFFISSDQNSPLEASIFPHTAPLDINLSQLNEDTQAEEEAALIQFMQSSSPFGENGELSGDEVRNLHQNKPAFDKDLSAQRYALVNVIFDHMITHRLTYLRKAWIQLRGLEQRPLAYPLKDKLQKARLLLSTSPVDRNMATDANFAALFSDAYLGTTQSVLQSRLEKEWKRKGSDQIAQANSLIRQVHQSLEKQ